MLRRIGLRLELGKKPMEGRRGGVVRASRPVLGAGLIAVVVITALAATAQAPHRLVRSGPLAGGGTARQPLRSHPPETLSRSAANVTAPSAFTLVGAPSARERDSHIKQPAPAQRLNLAPGATQAVTSRSERRALWRLRAILAKQSNGFNGPPGTFHPADRRQQPLVRLGLQAHLGHARSAFVNTLITGTAVDSGAPNHREPSTAARNTLQSPAARSR
jgi:hypothetical protein